jgi:hypothetical protein
MLEAAHSFRTPDLKVYNSLVHFPSCFFLQVGIINVDRIDSAMLTNEVMKGKICVSFQVGIFGLNTFLGKD